MSKSEKRRCRGMTFARNYANINQSDFERMKCRDYGTHRCKEVREHPLCVQLSLVSYYSRRKCYVDRRSMERV